MHKKCIVHRDLRTNGIYIKKKKDKIQTIIGLTNFSHMLKKNHTIQQSFSVDRSLAPEIKKGEPQDMAVDIWSLG